MDVDHPPDARLLAYLAVVYIPHPDVGGRRRVQIQRTGDRRVGMQAQGVGVGRCGRSAVATQITGFALRAGDRLRVKQLAGEHPPLTLQIIQPPLLQLARQCRLGAHYA